MTNKLTPTGWPRPIVDGWPIPWVSPSDSLATMNSARLVACATGAVCAVCGEGYGEGEEAFVFVRGEERPDKLDATIKIQPMDNAIMHRRCAVLAACRCPKLKELSADGLLHVIKTEGNVAEIRVHTDGSEEPKAMLSGEDCSFATLESLKHKEPPTDGDTRPA